MKSLKTVCAFGLVGVFVMLLVAWNPSSQSFNANQFSSPQFNVNIKNGVQLTNPVSWTSFTVNGTNPASFFGGGITVTGDVVQVSGSNYYGGGAGISNLVMVLNTNAPGAAFKAIGNNGGSTAYVTNLTGNITLAAFDLTGIRADSVWSILIHAVADSSSRTVTMPSGVVGTGLALPCVFTVTNAQSANFQIFGVQGQWTNVAWMAIY